MKTPSDVERAIATIAERPWEATMGHLVQVMAVAEIEKLGFKCKIGDGRFKVELTLTELGEE
ncbi:MAG: hypothetical protein ACLU6O_07855 [Bilophila wadsworthia]